MANLRLRENANKSMKFLYEQFQVKITTRLKEDQRRKPGPKEAMFYERRALF